MRKKTLTLIETNPYLQDFEEREAWLNRSVISSSAIEGVHIAACRALGVTVKTRKAKGRPTLSKSSQ